MAAITPSPRPKATPAAMPRWKKILFLVLGLIYVLSPLDLIPEALLPFVGWLDDLGILALLARYVLFHPTK